MSNEESNEMSDHSVERLIEKCNGFNAETEQLIDEIEHIKIEEDLIDQIHDEELHYYGEDNYLIITNKENSGTGV